MSKKNRNLPRPGGGGGGRGLSMPGGMGGMMGGGGGGMGNLLAQAQKIQQEMEKEQAALSTVEVTGSAGGGAVTVVATGGQEIKAITIKPEVVSSDDVEMLQDLVLLAVNEALQKAKALGEEKMGALTGGLGLPPGLGV